MARSILSLAVVPLLLAGCVQGSQAPTPAALIVRYVDVVPRENDLRWAPWHRAEDDFTPGMVYFAVSVTGHACRLPAGAWSTVRAGQPLACDWRASHGLAASLSAAPN